MSSDSQFTALGPTQVGFQCHGANIRVGGTMSGTANGVEATCGTALGTGGAAVHAQSNTFNGNGVIAAAHSGPQAFGIWAASAEGFAGNFDGKVRVNGNLIVSGTKSAAVRTSDGALRLLYAIESPENWFEDFGFGHLENGYVRIDFDDVFADVIADGEYHVFLTQYDGEDGIYPTERDSSGFTVRSARSTVDCDFSYRVTAKRKDAANVRFEESDEPDGKTFPELPQNLEDHT